MLWHVVQWLHKYLSDFWHTNLILYYKKTEYFFTGTAASSIHNVAIYVI